MPLPSRGMGCTVTCSLICVWRAEEIIYSREICRWGRVVVGGISANTFELPVRIKNLALRLP